MTAGFDGGVAPQSAMTVIPVNEVDLEGHRGSPLQHLLEVMFLRGGEHMAVLGRIHVGGPPVTPVTEPHFDEVGPSGGSAQSRSEENEPGLVQVGEGPFDLPAHQGPYTPSPANLKATQGAGVGWRSRRHGVVF